MLNMQLSQLPAKTFLNYANWIALLILFLLAGTLGHDPWKQDETYSFGIIYHFYTTHTWLIPTNAGEFFLEKPPLYYWTGAQFCRLFASVLPLHDAARLTSSFYMLITCVAVWGTSQVVFQKYAEKTAMGCMTLILLLGCVGLLPHAHEIITDMALLAGTSLTLLGMALLLCRQQQWLLAGLTLGIGIGIAFLSKGFFMPIIFGISGIILFIMLPRLRMHQTGFALLIAFFTAAPFLFIWPWKLYEYSPEWFMKWFWENNLGRFLGFSVHKLGADNPPGYILYTVLWFAFPAFPLAVATVIKKRNEWREPAYILPFIISVTGLAFLLASASARALYLLPLLPGFALLGTQTLMHLPERLLARWNLSIRIVISVMALAVVIVWVGLSHPAWPQPLSKFYGQWLPVGFVPATAQLIACICALAIALFWFDAFRCDGRHPVNAAYTWFAGIALLWGVSMTLLLPWMDEARSFRSVMSELSAFASRPPYNDTCIAKEDIGESIAPMWQYFGGERGMGPYNGFGNTTCQLLIDVVNIKEPHPTDPRWHVVWRGSRFMDDKEELRLLERN